MSNPVSFKVVDYDGAIYIYDHWGKDRARENLAATLAKKWRWEDGPYFRRILLETLVDREGWRGKETGFGISSQNCNGARVYTITIKNQTVTCPDGVSYTFDEFVEKFDPNKMRKSFGPPEYVVTDEHDTKHQVFTVDWRRSGIAGWDDIRPGQQVRCATVDGLSVTGRIEKIE